MFKSYMKLVAITWAVGMTFLIAQPAVDVFIRLVAITLILGTGFLVARPGRVMLKINAAVSALIPFTIMLQPDWPVTVSPFYRPLWLIVWVTSAITAFLALLARQSWRVERGLVLMSFFNILGLPVGISIGVLLYLARDLGATL